MADTVIQELQSTGKYRVRIVKPAPDGDVMVDIREYVCTSDFQGFTRRGVRLTIGQAIELGGTMDVVRRMFKEVVK